MSGGIQYEAVFEPLFGLPVLGVVSVSNEIVDPRDLSVAGLDCYLYL